MDNDHEKTIDTLSVNLATLTQITKEHIVSDEKFQEELHELISAIREDLKPLLEAYSGVLFGRKLIIGISSLVLAIASIGGVVMWMIDYLKK